jgi:hypothetical protein
LDKSKCSLYKLLDELIIQKINFPHQTSQFFPKKTTVWINLKARFEILYQGCRGRIVAEVHLCQRTTVMSAKLCWRQQSWFLFTLITLMMLKSVLDKSTLSLNQLLKPRVSMVSIYRFLCK